MNRWLYTALTTWREAGTAERVLIACCATWAVLFPLAVAFAR